MPYIAHKDEDREQTLKAHLEGTAQLAEKFASKFGKGEWGYCCGMLHDIGKYSDAFQKKIRENGNEMVDHATAGAQFCDQLGGRYGFLKYCIAGHHAGMPDYGGEVDAGGMSTLVGRLRKRIADYHAFESEIAIPKLTTDPFDIKKSADPDFSMSVFMRMLYSCLVDADYLDTEAFMKNGKAERDAGVCIDTLLAKLEDHISGWLTCEETESINGRRTEILRHCMEMGESARGLFRLTVPTGGGKTIASLAFALRHAKVHHMDRIIYVIPYTSIIEQNAKVFRDILGDENVLEHHCNVEYGDPELDAYNPMQLATENWDKPVIVTTNVQFFESLFANRSSKCRKLHNIANAVVVFDEAQMLPNDYLKPCVAMMEELVNQYRASIVLCTATQPALPSFFRNMPQAKELCPGMEEQFRFFERTVFQNAGRLTEDALTEKLGAAKQALCILNTKKRAQSLYLRLQSEGIYHLSTSMYPNHRRRVLDTVRARLRNKEKCILIATSLVEAGVDLDFPLVFRQLAGVDSMIQAAGRCNREGKRAAVDSIVTVFQFEEKEMIPGQRQQLDTTVGLLREGADVFSLPGIEQYFQRLYHIKGDTLDKKCIMDAFRNKRYQFAQVGKAFRLIEEDTKTIFVAREEEAKQLLARMRQGGYTKTGMRKAAQYCVQVRGNVFDCLYGAGMLREVSEDIRDFYELTDAAQYTDEMGLNLRVESGIAQFI